MNSAAGLAATFALTAAMGRIAMADDAMVRIVGHVDVPASISAPLRNVRVPLTISDDAGHIEHVQADRSGDFVVLGLAPGVIRVAVDFGVFVPNPDVMYHAFSGTVCRVPAGATARIDLTEYEGVPDTYTLPLPPPACPLAPASDDRTIVTPAPL